eukprot:jgi/Tetstr1/458737/TSEL_004348.t1
MDDLNARPFGQPGMPATMDDPAIHDADVFMVPRHARAPELTRYMVPLRVAHANQHLVRWASTVWTKAGKDDAYRNVAEPRLAALLARMPPSDTADYIDPRKNSTLRWISSNCNPNVEKQ